MPASSRGRTRLAETGVALGIGLCVHLMLYSGAQAASLTSSAFTDLPAVAGALGGLVGALVHIGGVLAVPPVEGRSRNMAVTLLEAVFSVVVGGITAEYGAVPLAGVLPFVPESSAPVAGFGIGVFAWAAAPGVIGGMRLAASPKRVARAVAANLSKWLAEPEGDK